MPAKVPYDFSAWKDVRGRLAQATQILTDAANDPRMATLAADKSLSAGDYFNAKRLFTRACELAPDDLDALEGLAMVLSASQEYPAAVETYRKILSLARDKTASGPATSQATAALEDAARRATFNLAVTYSRMEQFEQAIPLYRKLIESSPEYVPARFNLAILYQASDQASQAIDAWQEVVKLSGQMAPADAAYAHLCLAKLLETRQPAEAAQACVQATKLTPNDPTAWLDLSAARLAEGKLGFAEAAARQATELAKTSDTAWEQLGRVRIAIYRTNNNSKTLFLAIEAFNLSLQINPDQPALRADVQRYQAIAESQPADAPASEPATSHE